MENELRHREKTNSVNSKDALPSIHAPDRTQVASSAGERIVQKTKDPFPLASKKPTVVSNVGRRQNADNELEGFKEDWISFDMLLLLGVGFLMAVVMIFAVLKGDVGVKQSLDSWLPHGGRGQVPDLRFRIAVSLEAMYIGQSVDVRSSESKQIICDACRGSGAKDGAGVSNCPDCKGTGSQHVRVQLAPGFVQQFQQECARCQGRGRVVKHRCPKCQGQRVLSQNEDITINIPKGCAEGQVLRMSREGHQVPDVGVGDIVVEVSSSSHALFRRDKDNLHYTLTVSLKEALLGFEKKITHLDGREIQVSRLDRVTPHKTVIEIINEGIPRGRGSLYVTIDVQFPKSLTTKQSAEIRALLS